MATSLDVSNDARGPSQCGRARVALILPSTLLSNAGSGGRAGRLTQHAPWTVQGLKRSLNEIARGTADPAALHSRYVESLRSEDFREG
jgi:hypothetical protein